jgi:hypothetical protein
LYPVTEQAQYRILRIRIQFCTFFTNLEAAKLLCDFFLETADGLEFAEFQIPITELAFRLQAPVSENPLVLQVVEQFQLPISKSLQ